MGFTADNGKFHNISLGQGRLELLTLSSIVCITFFVDILLGQDVVAEKALDQGSLDGHWVVLQNIHLVARWLPQLEKKLEQTSELAHEEFRVFLSAEPAPDPDGHVRIIMFINNTDVIVWSISILVYSTRHS